MSWVNSKNFVFYRCRGGTDKINHYGTEYRLCATLNCLKIVSCNYCTPGFGETKKCNVEQCRHCRIKNEYVRPMPSAWVETSAIILAIACAASLFALSCYSELNNKSILRG